MSRKDAVVLASRALALFFAVWALGEASYLPERLHSFLHYMDEGFLVIRIIGYSLLARWLYRGGPEVEELLSQSASQEKAAQG
jgi:hypothetical protein